MKPPPSALKQATSANLASTHPRRRLQEGMRRQHATAVRKGNESFRHKDARWPVGGDLDKASKEGADTKKMVSSMSWPPSMTKSFPRSRSTPRPHDQRSASQLRRAEVFIKSRKAGRRGAPLRQYTSAATSPPTRPKSRASTHRRRSPRRRRRPHVPGPPPRHPTTRHITSAARRQPRQHHQEHHRSHQSPPHRTWMRLQRPHQPDPAGNEGQQPPEPRIRRL